MPTKTIVAALSLVLCLAVPSHAALQCKQVVATFTLAPDPQCQILARPDVDSEFPDVTFLAELGVPGTCFTGTLVGTLGTTPIAGQSVSGLTLASFPPTTGMFSAATSADLQTVDRTSKSVGTLFLRDVGTFLPDGTVSEQLVVTGGSKQLSGAKGTIFINGNEFLGASVTGTLCTNASVAK